MQSVELDHVGLLKIAELLQDDDRATFLAIGLIRLEDESNPFYEHWIREAENTWGRKDGEPDVAFIDVAYHFLLSAYTHELNYLFTEGGIMLEPEELLTHVNEELAVLNQPTYEIEKLVLEAIREHLETFIAGMRYQAMHSPENNDYY